MNKLNRKEPEDNLLTSEEVTRLDKIGGAIMVIVIIIIVVTLVKW